MQRLASRDVAPLDPYTFMALMGKRGRVAARPAPVRQMAWLMSKMAKAVPFLGCVLVAGTKPAKVA